jgi:class 3 adenylate cyclase
VEIMTTDRVERRLAAILAADVAGYSRLMGVDDVRTVRDLKGHQAVALPMVREFGGRIIDTAGDGILAEFSSVVNAVKSAVAIQSRIAERNAAIKPEQRIQFRMGVNIGDVIYDDSRIYGEGINIAARLEGIAQPGGICVSGSVQEQVQDKLNIAFEDIGEQQLKNIARSVRVYRLVLDQSRVPTPRAARTSVPPRAAPPASNIPVRVPTHFLGRDDALAGIETALDRYEGRVAITALHGLRGVGKTTIAAVYADRHRSDYRATWWIRAQTASSMRADLVALGLRLGWIGADEKEGRALTAVLERLRYEGDRILLIYDNAIDANTLEPYLPRGGACQVLVTSNAHAWRGVAEPVEISIWRKEIGANYLIARTGRHSERNAAEILSESLGGLPLAHEQAAAYCERLDISLAEYCRRFAAAPARMLDDTRHAPAEYHDGLTVAKTFGLAIEEAAKLYPAAEPFIVHTALLAPEPIPLFLFAEVREKFGEPLATALAGDGLEEAVAALRTFALLSRETIVDERDPAITTETMRLHRLVRQVAVTRWDRKTREDARRALVEAFAAIYPEAAIYLPVGDSRTWPRARRLEALALALVEEDENHAPAEGAEAHTAELLHKLSAYKSAAFASYRNAQLLEERSLAIRERVCGPEHPDTAASLCHLGFLVEYQGHFAEARQLYERALAINQKVLGPDHRATEDIIITLDRLRFQRDLVPAPLLERMIASREKALGPEDTRTLVHLIALADLHFAQGDFAQARSLCERILTLSEKVLDPAATSRTLETLGRILKYQDDLAGARPLFERALAISEKALGPEHPQTAYRLTHLASCLDTEGDLARARPLHERAVAICEKTLGPEHSGTAICLMGLVEVLRNQRDFATAQRLCGRALEIDEKLHGSSNRRTAQSLSTLAALLCDRGDFSESRKCYERALATLEVSSPEHPNTNRVRCNFARLLLAAGSAAEALTFGETALASHEKIFGKNHRWTRDSARTTADALAALGRAEEGKLLLKRYGLEPDAPRTPK